MPSTFNGFGSFICGERKLTKDEINAWITQFPHVPKHTSSDFYIGTESIGCVILGIPRKTYVYCYDHPFIHRQYQILFYPAGEGKVYWKHILSCLEFYQVPIFLIVLIIWYLFFSKFFTAINVFWFFFLFFVILVPVCVYIYNKVKFGG